MKSTNPILAVVRYPKTIRLFTLPEFHIYSKTSSNREVMEEYYKHLATRLSDEFHVKLVTRTDAWRMAHEWRVRIEALERKYVDEYAKRMR